MVGWLGRRAEPRVGFRREVHVSWPGQASGVIARAVNLSPTGILVDAPTPEPCPVGSPVLRADTEVEIALSPDANLATKGWVSSVALDNAGEDGIPRLVIDIRAGESAAPRLAPDAAVSGQVESSQAPAAPAASSEVGAV